MYLGTIARILLTLSDSLNSLRLDGNGQRRVSTTKDKGQRRSTWGGARRRRLELLERLERAELNEAQAARLEIALLDASLHFG